MLDSALLGAGAALVGVALTWALTELSAVLRRRREDRERCNAVLAELLEIRHLVLVQPTLTDLLGTILQSLDPAHLQALGPVSPEAREAFNRWVAQLAPPSQPLEERYAQAVTELARVAPELSYRLRHQSLPLKLGLAWAGVASAVGASSDHIAMAQRVLAEEVGADLDDAILDVASRAGGFWGKVRVRRVLRRNPRSDDEVRDELRRLATKLIEVLPPVQRPDS